MTISMYKASVPVFVQFLTSLSAVLDKAAAYAEATKVEPSVLLNTRLAPDMFPLVRQVRAATDHAVNAGGRLSGSELPTFTNTEATIPELKDRIAKTIEFLKGLKPAQIDGTEGKEIKITFPSGQVRAATDHAINACGRLAGADMPSFSNTETTIPELKDRIAKTIDFLKGLKPAQIDGSEDKAIKITFPSGATREFTGQSLLLTNSLPNFYFHCTTAYDILRHCGVELGKRDFMGTPVSL